MTPKERLARNVDLWAAQYGITRLPGESNDSVRKRYRTKVLGIDAAAELPDGAECLCGILRFMCDYHRSPN